MTSYDDVVMHPDSGMKAHPLAGVRQATLDVARNVLADAAVYGDIAEDVIEPIADAVVLELLKSGSVGEVQEISALLVEVYRLRRALAYEAGVTKAHLDLRSFPASRRRVAEEQVERMRECARGKSRVAYAGTATWALAAAMNDAGAGQTLTRSDFLKENPDVPRGGR